MGTYRAVKIIYRHTFKDIHPFEREYNGIRKFEPVSRSHEGLMDILQIGRNDQDGYFYYVMELADDANAECGARNAESALTRPSDTLSHPMGEGRGEGIGSLYAPKTIHSEISRRGRLPFEECLQLSLSLTAALDHLHKGGLVHRDIKPSNIIFVNGMPKLADIGLVADADDTKSFVGTEGFIPPEGPGTPQADIYSLGKVLYEIATGKDRRNFPEPPTLVADFPERELFLELNEVIIRACETNLRTRYHSAEEIHSDLALLLSGKSVKHLRAMERRLAIMTRIGLVSVAVMVLGAFPYFMAIKEARHATRDAGRARLAEADAKEKLSGAYLAQAQAGRWSHRPGRRFGGLELLKKAAEIRPSLELRNEAIACMALSDLRLVTDLPAIPETGRLGECLDRKYERYVYADDQAPSMFAACRMAPN